MKSSFPGVAGFELSGVCMFSPGLRGRSGFLPPSKHKTLNSGTGCSFLCALTWTGDLEMHAGFSDVQYDAEGPTGVFQE